MYVCMVIARDTPHYLPVMHGHAPKTSFVLFTCVQYTAKSKKVALVIGHW